MYRGFLLLDLRKHQYMIDQDGWPNGSFKECYNGIMKRLTTIIYISLSLLLTTLMVGHGHGIMAGHDMRLMATAGSCQSLCLAAASGSNHIDALKPVTATLLGILLTLGVFFLMSQSSINRPRIQVFSRDPAPPDILAITQRLRF